MAERNSTEVPHAPALSYWIVPGRFLAGPNPYGAGNPKRILELLGVGIDTFISLQQGGEFGIRNYSRALHQAASSLARKVHFLRRPIPDAGVCLPKQMSEILDTIDSRFAAGHVIYLHCWAGNGRTGWVVGCWLVRHGLSGEDALRRIEELRSHDEYLASWSSPHTAQQFDMVGRWNSLEME
jgi:hypothetical protein